MEKYGKRRVVCHREHENVRDRLEQVAEVFDMNPFHYAKAVLYLNLNMLNIPLDCRRRTWKQRVRREYIQ